MRRWARWVSAPGPGPFLLPWPCPLDVRSIQNLLSVFHLQQEKMKRQAVSTSLHRLFLFISLWPEITAAWQIKERILHSELLTYATKSQTLQCQERGEQTLGHRAVSTTGQCIALTCRKTHKFSLFSTNVWNNFLLYFILIRQLLHVILIRQLNCITSAEQCLNSNIFLELWVLCY